MAQEEFAVVAENVIVERFDSYQECRFYSDRYPYPHEMMRRTVTEWKYTV